MWRLGLLCFVCFVFECSLWWDWGCIADVGRGGDGLRLGGLAAAYVNLRMRRPFSSCPD